MPPQLTVQFIRNYTAEPIGNALVEAAMEVGVLISPRYGAFDNLGAEVAALARSEQPPAMVVVTIDLAYFSGGIFSPGWSVAQVTDDLTTLL
ncbi:MAG: hypothetical protein DME25_01280, partial [Verrucomicrobia bacterium]